MPHRTDDLPLAKSNRLPVPVAAPLLARPRRWWWSLAAGVVFVIGVTATEIGIGLYRDSLQSEAAADAVNMAAQLRARVDSELNSIIYLSSGLSAYFTIHANALDDDEIERMLALLYRDSRHTRNFGVAVGYVLTYVYPKAGNEAAIGLDYRSVPDQFGAVQDAIARRAPTLSRRLDLVQGGHGVIYRAPIFVGGSYWGLLSTVIDIDALLGAAFSGVAPDTSRFALREAGPSGAVLWGEPSLFDDLRNPQLRTDAGWEFVVAPRANPRAVAMQHLMRALGYVFAVLLACTTFLAYRQRGELLRLSRVDDLTGLANRRVLDERVGLGLARLRRSPDEGFALIFVDLDDFKRINDSLGHRAGDAVLKAIAERLFQQFRPTDLLARWGGDEFAAYVDECREGELRNLQSRLRGVFAQPVMFHGAPIPIHGSVGFAIAPRDGIHEEALVAAADRHMYLQKSDKPS